MLDTENSNARFSPDAEFEEEEGYRPLSPLAVVAFVGSLLSLTAALHPLLWVLPAVTIVLSMSALWTLARPGSQHSGKLLAASALVVTMLVAGYAPARTMSRQQALYDQSRVFAEAWIDLVLQDQIHEAHQLTLPFVERYSGDLTLDEYYADQLGLVMRQRAEAAHSQREREAMQYAMHSGMAETPSAKLQQFVERETIKRLRELPGEVEIRFRGNVSQLRDGKDIEFVQRFAAVYRVEGREREYEFPLQLLREYSYEDADRYWEIHSIDSPE